MLRDFYYSDDRRVESAVLSLDEASRINVTTLQCSICTLILIIHHPFTQDPASKLAAIKAAHKFFSDSDDKDRTFEAKVKLQIRCYIFTLKISIDHG